MTNQMPDDRDMNSALRGWLRDDDELAADRNRQIGRIMGRVDETRQRRRLWPLNPFGRRAVHSAEGTDGSAFASGRTRTLVPASVMAVVVMVVFVAAGLLYVAARPTNQETLPGAVYGAVPSPLPMDPADEVLFERMAGLWTARSSDAAAALEIYAEDAVHTVLWTDDLERIRGNDAIASRMRRSASVPREEPVRIRVPDDWRGAHRYLTVTPSLGGMPCVIWIKDEHIARHDCIMPMSIGDVTPPDFPAADPSSVSAVEELRAMSLESWAGDRETFDRVVSPDIAHHVGLDDHSYTLRGIDEYWAITRTGGTVEVWAPTLLLPAPDGELRWTDFNNVGGGSLCTFWSRDDQIIRHDCIVPTSMDNQSPGTTDPE